MKNTKKIRKGDRVRDVKWGGKYTGTVVRTAGLEVFVQWDNLAVAVEDELFVEDVSPAPQAQQGLELPA